MNTASEFLGEDSVFAKKLKSLREERGISQKTLATGINASRQAVAQYEDGTALPNIEKLYKIAKFFEVSTDWLLGLDDSPIPDINDREMSNRLGLTSGSIQYLRSEVEGLLEKTNRSTIEEALDVQSKVIDFLAKRHSREEFEAFIKEMNLPQSTAICKNGYEVISLLGLTPSFKTINTLIEDRRVLPTELPDEYCCLSILEALEAAFRQEKFRPDTKFIIAEVDTKNKAASYWRDEKGSYERSEECIYNLRLLDLQTSMRAHKVKMSYRAMVENKRKKKDEDGEE